MSKHGLFTWVSTGLACALLGVLPGCGDDDEPDPGTNGGTAGRAGGAGGGGRLDAGAGGRLDAGAGSGGAAAGADDGGAGGEAPEALSRVRVVHLSPDAPAVDVFANGQLVLEGLEFPEGSDYLEVPAGTYAIDVAPSGETVDDAVLSVDALTLDAEGFYTAVAYDTLAAIQALALVDDYTALETDQIRVRAIHAAFGVGEVDIWNITDPEAPEPLYEDVDFGSAGDALDVPAGAYTLGIDVDDDALPDLVFELPELEGGTLVNLFAVAEVEDVFLVAQLPDGSTVRIDPE